MDKPVCIIPARAGSKRLPGKNMAVLGGKPLLAWAIDTALRAGIFEEVVVSSDDPKALLLAESTDGVIASERPAELCGDNVRAEVVFQYEVSQLADKPDIVCMSMPTAPFTGADSLMNAYNYMVEARLNGVFLGVATNHNSMRTVSVDVAGNVTPVHGLGGWRGSINAQSQDLDPTYQPTYGGMFIKTDMLLEAPYYYAFCNQGMYEVPQWQGIDIDNEFDLMEAQQWLIERQQDLQEKV